MAPAAPGLLHRGKAGAVKRARAAVRLRGHQPHLLPLARTLGGAASARCHRADHAAVSLGDELARPFPGQNAKALPAARLLESARPFRVQKRRLTRGGGTQAKAVMLL